VTIEDPELEEQRAREAVERERESRLSDQTKYDERRDLEKERERGDIVGDVPPRPAARASRSRCGQPEGGIREAAAVS
jgi:hypothetical protein